MQRMRTKTDLLKYVEALHWALERELTTDFHEDTIPQLKSWIRRTENRLERCPDGINKKKNAMQQALAMSDDQSLLVPKALYKNKIGKKTFHLCRYHTDGLGWDACSDDSSGCEIKQARLTLVIG